jgi:AcrR family transcriptional regulator
VSADAATGAPSARTTPRERRRAETTAEIVAAAWELARHEGLAGISMRDLGSEVGLKAQSLYAYFDSKAALYDAMFRGAHEVLAARTRSWQMAVRESSDPRVVAKELTGRFVDFCTEDPVRYQLLFQRVIPDWEPSPESYELAVEQLDLLRRFLAEVGIESDGAVDLWTAIVTGLTSQQISNEPGGTRWTSLVDGAVDMFFNHYVANDRRKQ